MNGKARNILTIKGNKNLLKKFDEDFKSEHIVYCYDDRDNELVKEVFKGYSLENFVPRSFEVYKQSNYEWEMNNWGCVDDISDVVLVQTKDYWTYSFYSPNFSPMNVVRKISYTYPGIEFDIIGIELGERYINRYVYKDGQSDVIFSVGPDISAVKRIIETLDL